MEKKSSTIERVLIAISLVWGFYNISRPIFEKSNFNYFNVIHWILFVLYVVLFIGVVYLLVELGTWIYQSNEKSSIFIKRFLAIVGGLVATAFVITWDKIVVPYFVQVIGV